MHIPLVLLSGLASNQHLWKHQMLHLSDIANVHIISAAQDSAQKMVQAILDEAPPQFALAGHSMGGWLCLEVMRAAPARVSKLCLLNTTARMDSEEKRARRQQMVRKAENGQFRDVVKGLVENFVFNPLAKNDVEKMFLEAGPETFIHQENAMIARQECQSILPCITCPTLVVHAMQDSVFARDDQRELVDRIPGSKLAMVEDSGHMSPMEMPQAITSLLKFWVTYF